MMPLIIEASLDSTFYLCLLHERRDGYGIVSALLAQMHKGHEKHEERPGRTFVALVGFVAFVPRSRRRVSAKLQPRTFMPWDERS
jgi:hypothetical protein